MYDQNVQFGKIENKSIGKSNQELWGNVLELRSDLSYGELSPWFVWRDNQMSVEAFAHKPVTGTVSGFTQDPIGASPNIAGIISVLLFTGGA